MAYANSAALRGDAAFFGRLDACCCEQALTYKDDGRADIAALAEDVLVKGASGLFPPFICSQPGFGEVTDSADITDGQILAAVQAVWPEVAAMTHGDAA